jgi:thiamine pyrophosphokinase
MDSIRQRALIVANGWLNRPTEIPQHDFLIAADGGTHHCIKLGLHPDYVVGDLDSLDEQVLAALITGGTQIIQYPTRKDYTDLELALQQALHLGATEIIILAALGARWDQTVANLLLPAALPQVRIWLVDGAQELTFIHSGEELTVAGKPGDTVSLIPLGGDAHGITTTNLEYPLTDDNLRFGSTRGVSNVLLTDQGTIVLEKGLLLCTIIHL